MKIRFVKFARNYLEMHIIGAVKMHKSDYRRVDMLPIFKQGWSKASPLFGQITSPDA